MRTTFTSPTAPKMRTATPAVERRPFPTTDTTARCLRSETSANSERSRTTPSSGAFSSTVMEIDTSLVAMTSTGTPCFSKTEKTFAA